MTAALAWRQLRSSELKETPAAQGFRQLYHVYLLRASVREQQIGQAAERLHAAGVDAVLAKGWLAAQLYPGKGMRHSGDIDLYVATDQYRAASAALFDGSCPDLPVDLHQGCPDLKDRPFEELCRRSQTKNVGGTKILVMGPEDHLRLLCMHQLRHGIKHAIGLCDIAALVESLHSAFDWEYCMSGDR
ncbi:MAG: nucleotidyltransferase family protein, partial [Chloroflexi bacterium]|nr:nucleotidyltransferase family protein [Chloroflexota bacterium]